MTDPVSPKPSEAVDLPVSFARLPLAALHIRDQRVVAANAAYESFMQVPAREVVGQSIDELVGRFVVPKDVALLDGANDDLRAGTAADGTLWCTVTDGTGRVRPIRVRWEPAQDGVGTIVFLLDAEGDARDKRFAETLARAGGELVLCRNERTVLGRATAALESQGLTATVRLVTQSDPPAIAEASIADSPARHLVKAPLVVDGRSYGALIVTGERITPSQAGTIEIFAELIVRAIENVRLHEAAARRVAELERLQSELVERERLAALGEAAAVMAHEVRNPISAILNAVAVMRRVAAGGVESVDMMRIIQEEALRLERLVRDLLDLGRPLLPRRRAVDLYELTCASVGLLRDRHECGGVLCEMGADPGGLFANVDPDLVQLAVLNVARNAAQASPPGATVHITVDRVGDSVRIAVEDAGPGMNEDVVRRAFEPFFTTRPAGTGIGLAVVRRVVEVHAGEVRVSRGEGRGTRVELLFASAASPSSPP